MLIRYESLSKKTGKPNTKTRCLIECCVCNKQLWRSYKVFKNHRSDLLIGDDFCHSCMMNLDSYRNNMSNSIRKMINLDPDWKARNSKSKKGKINLGNKNGMKQKEARSKVSKSRKKLFENLDEREKISKQVANAWINGAYDNAPVGKCKWYVYEKNDGSKCKVQGKWELAYANWLDQNNINFIAHRGRILYNDIEGKTRSYFPDFYLPDSDLYIDVKNKYHYSLSKEKFILISEQNADVKIKILFKEDLESLGVKIEKY